MNPFLSFKTTESSVGFLVDHVSTVTIVDYTYGAKPVPKGHSVVVSFNTTVIRNNITTNMAFIVADSVSQAQEIFDEIITAVKERQAFLQQQLEASRKTSSNVFWKHSTSKGSAAVINIKDIIACHFDPDIDSPITVEIVIRGDEQNPHSIFMDCDTRSEAENVINSLQELLVNEANATA